MNIIPVLGIKHKLFKPVPGSIDVNGLP